MTDNTDKLMAEALVECGYADRISNKNDVCGVHVTGSPNPHRKVVNPFYSGPDLIDECHARRQLDALEDWLYDKHGDLVGRLFADGEIYKTANRTHSEWRRFNIKWCFEQLADKS